MSLEKENTIKLNLSTKKSNPKIPLSDDEGIISDSDDSLSGVDSIEALSDDDGEKDVKDEEFSDVDTTLDDGNDSDKDIDKDDGNDSDGELKIDTSVKEMKTPISILKTKDLESVLTIGESSNYMGDVDDESTDEEDEDQFQKFNTNIGKNYILDFHPEKIIHNHEEVTKLSIVKRDKQNNIVDPFHKTTSILTKYERARILGQRAKQIDEGASPMVDVSSETLDGYIIALEELKQKKIPFIISRPLQNGGAEYWKIRDLEVLD